LQISVLLAPLRVASKTAFVTVKPTIDTSNSSNTVLLFLILTDQSKEMTEETRVLESIEKVLESLTEKATS
jgi:hypothetical protein